MERRTIVAVGCTALIVILCGLAKGLAPTRASVLAERSHVAELKDWLAECEAAVHTIIKEETRDRRESGYVEPRFSAGQLLAKRHEFSSQGEYATSFYRGDSPRLDAAWDHRAAIREELRFFEYTEYGEGPGYRSEPAGDGDDPGDSVVPEPCICAFDTHYRNYSTETECTSWGATYQVDDGICDGTGCPNPKNCQGSITLDVEGPPYPECNGRVYSLETFNGNPVWALHNPPYTEELDLACGARRTYKFTDGSQILGAMDAECHDCGNEGD